MNFKKEIKNLKGQSFQMSFVSENDLTSLKEKTGKDTIKIEDLPRETVGNVLLNCLANYSVVDKKDIFKVQALGIYVNQVIELGDEAPELSDTLKSFLVKKVLTDSILRKPKTDDEKEKQKDIGLYSSWVIAQVLEELGVKELE